MGVGEGLGLGVGEGLGVGDGLGVGEGLGIGVGDGVGVGEGEADAKTSNAVKTNDRRYIWRSTDIPSAEENVYTKLRSTTTHKRTWYNATCIFITLITTTTIVGHRAVGWIGTALCRLHAAPVRPSGEHIAGC